MINGPFCCCCYCYSFYVSCNQPICTQLLHKIKIYINKCPSINIIMLEYFSVSILPNWLFCFSFSLLVFCCNRTFRYFSCRWEHVWFWCWCWWASYVQLNQRINEHNGSNILSYRRIYGIDGISILFFIFSVECVIIICKYFPVPFFLEFCIRKQTFY